MRNKSTFTEVINYTPPTDCVYLLQWENRHGKSRKWKTPAHVTFSLGGGLLSSSACSSNTQGRIYS